MPTVITMADPGIVAQATLFPDVSEEQQLAEQKNDARFAKIPSRVLQAMEKAMRRMVIPRCVRPTLAAICRNLSARQPFKPVFTHKLTFAGLAGAAESTIYRHLKWLVDNGVIERLKQDHKAKDGKFDKGHVRLTRPGAELLGLVQPELPLFDEAEADTKPAEKSNPPSLILGGGHKKGLTIPDVSKEDYPGEPENFSEKIAPKIEPRPAIVLPHELVAAGDEFGISPGGMGKLRGIAHRAGHKLEDIVVCARAYIHKLTLRGGRAFRYLETLAPKHDDYADKALQLLRDGKAGPRSEFTSRPELNSQYAGRSFIGSDGLTYRFRGDSAEVLDGGVILRLMTGGSLSRLYDDIGDGDLRLTEFTPGQAVAPAPSNTSGPDAATRNGLRAALKKMCTDHRDRTLSRPMPAA